MNQKTPKVFGQISRRIVKRSLRGREERKTQKGVFEVKTEKEGSCIRGGFFFAADREDKRIL